MAAGCATSRGAQFTPHKITLQPKSVLDPYRLGTLNPGCDTPQQCEQQCIGGNHDACIRRQFFKTGSEKTDGLKRLCDNGNIRACNYAGLAYTKLDKRSSSQRSALGAFEKACSGGNGLSCFNLGLIQLRPKSAFNSPSMATSAFARACGLGVARGCTYQVLLSVGPGGQIFGEVQRFDDELLLRACNDGDSYACAAYAYLSLRAPTTDSRPEALKHAEHACERGYSKVCALIARHHAQAAITETDRITHLRRACVYDENACVELMREDKGARIDREFLQRSCKQGAGSSCTRLDILDSSKAGTVAAKRQNIGHLCMGGHTDLCAQAAGLWQDAPPGKRDYRYAAQYFQHGCESKNANSCIGLGMMFEKGLGLPKSSLEARNGYRQACGLGDELGCVLMNQAESDFFGILGPVPAVKRGPWCGLGQDASGQQLLDCLIKPSQAEEFSLMERLLVASGVDDGAMLLKQLNRLNTILFHIATLTIKHTDGHTPMQTSKRLLELMHELDLTEYTPTLGRLQPTLETGKFNCVTSTLLYILAARRVGLQSSAWVMEGHIIATVFDTAGPIFVETTNPKHAPGRVWHNPYRTALAKEKARDEWRDAWGLSDGEKSDSEWDEIAEQIKKRVRESAQDVNDRELAGILLWNQTIQAVVDGDSERAIRTLRALFHTATKNAQQHLWAGRGSLLKSALDGVVKKQGHDKAIEILESMLGSLPDGIAKQQVRDLRAIIYGAWLDESISVEQRCAIIKSLEEHDAQHPLSKFLHGRSALCD